MNIKGKAKFLVLSGALIGITSQHSFAINEINEENNPQTNDLIRNVQDVPHNDDQNVPFNVNNDNDSIEESLTDKPDNQDVLNNSLNTSSSDDENQQNFPVNNNNDALPFSSDSDLSDNTPQNKVKFQLPNNNLSDDNLSFGNSDSDLSDDTPQNQDKPFNITNFQNPVNNNKFFNNLGSNIKEEDINQILNDNGISYDPNMNSDDDRIDNPVKTFGEFSLKIKNRDESIFEGAERFEKATEEVTRLQDSFENLIEELNDAKSSLENMNRSLEKERVSSEEKDKKLVALYNLETKVNELEENISFKEQKLEELATQLQDAKEKKSSYKRQLQELSVQHKNILQSAQSSEKKELLKLRKQQELTNRYLQESSEKDIAGLIAARNEERRQLTKMNQSNQELTEILQQTKEQHSEVEEQLSDLNNKLRSFAIGIGLIDENSQDNYGFDQILESSYQQYQQFQKESVYMRNKLQSNEEQIHILSQKLNNKKERLSAIRNQVINEDNYSVNEEEDQLLETEFDNNQDDSNFNKFAQIRHERLQNSSNKAGFNEFARIRGEKLKVQPLEKSEKVVDENASQHSDAESPSKIQKNNFENFAKIRQEKFKNSASKQTQNSPLKVSSVDTKKDDSKFNQFSNIRKSKLNNQKDIDNNSIQDNQYDSDSEA